MPNSHRRWKACSTIWVSEQIRPRHSENSYEQTQTLKLIWVKWNSVYRYHKYLLHLISILYWDRWLLCEYAHSLVLLSHQHSLLHHLILSSPLSSFPLLFSPLLFSLLCPAQVLTTGNWPTYKVMDLNLPPVMQRCVQFFQQYYTMEVRTDITDIYMMSTTQTESLHPTLTILNITQYNFLIHRVKALHTRDSSGPTHWAMQW